MAIIIDYLRDYYLRNVIINVDDISSNNDENDDDKDNGWEENA